MSAPDDASGDVWGDVFFANDLASALRQQRQIVHIDRLGSRNRPSPDYPDDVVVNLRGLTTPRHDPHALNYLWVISHPDLVTGDEAAAGVNRVFSASETWAEQKTAEWGLPVIPLLQAAGERFTPGNGSGVDYGDVVFVGASRNIARPVVLDVVRSDADLSIYGHGWEPFVEEKYVRSQHLDNTLLPDVYRSARIILNDHWEDMRIQGFVSNRLFEAAASGAHIISDAVNGSEELFGGLVRTYSSTEDLNALLCSEDGWPSREETLRLANKVRESHSFDSRAAVLLRYALSDYRR